MARRSRAGLFGSALWDSCGFSRFDEHTKEMAASSANAAYTWHLATDTLTWSPNAAEILGLTPEDLPCTGGAFADLTERHSGVDRLTAILLCEAEPTDDGTPFETRYALRLDPDRVLMIDDAGRFLVDEKGRPAFVRGVIQAQVGREGPALPHAPIEMRSALLEEIADHVAETRRSRHAVTLIVGAVEQSADDETAMAEISRSVRRLLRRSDHFALYTPDRFALALTSCTGAEAQNAMNRVLQVIAANPSLIEVSVRLGAASAPDHATSAADLLRRAEKAIDHAIAHGERATLYHERFATGSPEPCGSNPEDVIAALNGRDLSFVAQPVIDAASGRPILSTALPRMDVKGTVAAAQDLAPAMEEAGLSLLLDGRMLELVADHLMADRDAGLVLPIARATLEDPEWLTMLAAHLGIRPGIVSRLIVSVPETALGCEAAQGRLDAMKALGIGLAVRGFGTGHLPVEQLPNLPVDLAMIDGSFIQTLHRSTEDRLFVRKLIEQAHSCGIATIAEWVESEVTAGLLAEWGVDYLQGSLFGAARKPQQQAVSRQANIA